jgi:hypothetical protein
LKAYCTIVTFARVILVIAALLAGVPVPVFGGACEAQPVQGFAFSGRNTSLTDCHDHHSHGNTSVAEGDRDAGQPAPCHAHLTAETHDHAVHLQAPAGLQATSVTPESPRLAAEVCLAPPEACAESSQLLRPPPTSRRLAALGLRLI